MKRFLPRYRDCIVSSDSSLKDALKAIADSGALMACASDPSGKLQGILTDSDIRKALLSGARIDDSIKPWINTSPLTASQSLSEEDLYKLSISEGIREIPLVDIHGNLVDIFVAVIHDHRIEPTLANSHRCVVAETKPSGPIKAMLLLAGGKGIRLRSVISDRPKPLAIVGGQPIIQTIIQNAAIQGINKFYVAVNYMAEKITDHLASPSYKGLDFEVLKEESFLGTAGCIGMLPKDIQEPFIVANADILTTVNYQSLLDHHRREQAALTCVVRSHLMNVPFGVVDIQNGIIMNIVEKPNITNLVNAGIYVLNPELINVVGQNTYLDMPVLIQNLASRGSRISPFFMHEYWMDIGRPDDFHRANEEYFEHFGNHINDH